MFGYYFRKVYYKLDLITYKTRLKLSTLLYNLGKGSHVSAKYKCLYASPVGSSGKGFLKKIINTFGYKDFDYLIFVYDQTDFKEDIFKHCRFIREKGYKWQFMKKYLTPTFCESYDFVFVWDDDIDIEGFSYKNFLNIMMRNNLEVAQPALSPKSYYSHKITLQNPKYNIGRYTDFVEIMVPVFTKEAWKKFWFMIEPDYNFWGWGYDLIAKSYCSFKNMGIVDCEIVTHTKPLRGKCNDSYEEMKKFLYKNRKYRKSKMVEYGKLN